VKTGSGKRRKGADNLVGENEQFQLLKNTTYRWGTTNVWVGHSRTWTGMEAQGKRLSAIRGGKPKIQGGQQDLGPCVASLARWKEFLLCQARIHVEERTYPRSGGGLETSGDSEGGGGTWWGE